MSTWSELRSTRFLYGQITTLPVGLSDMIFSNYILARLGLRHGLLQGPSPTYY